MKDSQPLAKDFVAFYLKTWQILQLSSLFLENKCTSHIYRDDAIWKNQFPARQIRISHSSLIRQRFKSTVVNRRCPSTKGGLLENSCTIPLTSPDIFTICIYFCKYFVHCPTLILFILDLIWFILVLFVLDFLSLYYGSR